MELLQLSSISAGWISIGSVTEPADQAKLGGALAIMAALAAGRVVLAKADPHWATACERGHFDAGIDDDCKRLAKDYLKLTDEQIEEAAAEPLELRRLAHRIITCEKWQAVVARRLHTVKVPELATA